MIGLGNFSYAAPSSRVHRDMQLKRFTSQIFNTWLNYGAADIWWLADFTMKPEKISVGLFAMIFLLPYSIYFALLLLGFDNVQVFDVDFFLS